MRIIAGKHKGRKIEAGHPHNGIRPTSDFARESIFNILTHGKYALEGSPCFVDRAVLDVFCGSGAFGLEALSRGASSVTFIDQSREALTIARQNVAHVKEEDHAQFILTDATRLPKAREVYALAFLDPPYGRKMLLPALSSLKAGGWIDHESLIVIEQDEKEVLPLPEGFEQCDERRYGRAMIRIIRLTSA